jgi:hypothetical protein
MAKQLTEQELRQQAVRALSDSLGSVDALRFLALVSRELFGNLPEANLSILLVTP